MVPIDTYLTSIDLVLMRSLQPKKVSTNLLVGTEPTQVQPLCKFLNHTYINMSQKIELPNSVNSTNNKKQLMFNYLK